MLLTTMAFTPMVLLLLRDTRPPWLQGVDKALTAADKYAWFFSLPTWRDLSPMAQLSACAGSTVAAATAVFQTALHGAAWAVNQEPIRNAAKAAAVAAPAFAYNG